MTCSALTWSQYWCIGEKKLPVKTTGDKIMIMEWEQACIIHLLNITEDSWNPCRKLSKSSLKLYPGILLSSVKEMICEIQIHIYTLIEL